MPYEVLVIPFIQRNKIFIRKIRLLLKDNNKENKRFFALLRKK